MANIPDPITRKEQYYSYMAGESQLFARANNKRRTVSLLFMRQWYWWRRWHRHPRTNPGRCGSVLDRKPRKRGRIIRQ